MFKFEFVEPELEFWSCPKSSIQGLECEEMGLKNDWIIWDFDRKSRATVHFWNGIGWIWSIVAIEVKHHLITCQFPNMPRFIQNGVFIIQLNNGKIVSV